LTPRFEITDTLHILFMAARVHNTQLTDCDFSIVLWMNRLLNWLCKIEGLWHGYDAA
jgi:hypothetical protein